VILSLIASLLRTAEQCKAKKVEIRVALLHVPRFPTNYVISNLDSAPGLHRIRHASINTSSGKTSNVLLNTQMSK
jgi:hypothetical protein